MALIAEAQSLPEREVPDYVAPDGTDKATYVRVPTLVLQPIVENSIRHGLSGKIDGGSIRIRGSLAGQRLLLVIEDDGVGIPEGKLATLFEQGIGISNVNERLKVLFGANYWMSIDSKTAEGTRTEIEIPSGPQERT